MRLHGSRAGFGWGVLLACALLAGCSSSTGNRFTLFPEGHPLLDEAKALKAAAPEPLPIPKELDKRVLPPYTVEPGDVLLVQPADLDSPIRLPGDQPVLTDGSINLGRYGQLIVAGKTVEQIEVEIRAAIQNYLAAQPRRPAAPARPADTLAPAPAPLPEPGDVGPITVRLVTRVSKVYYVLGEVNAPGAFNLAGRETVLDGILAAGGLTDRASRGNIILARPTPPDGCRVVLPICYREIVQLGDTSTNYQLAPGDRIYVPSRTLVEDLFHRKQECPPCGRPQTPCTAVNGGCAGADAGPFTGTMTHYSGPAPAVAAPAPGPAPEVPPAQLPAAPPAGTMPPQARAPRKSPDRSAVAVAWNRLVMFFDFGDR